MARRRKHYPSYPSHPEVQTFQEGVECMDARRLLLMFSDTYGNLSPVESYADLAEMAAQHQKSGRGFVAGGGERGHRPDGTTVHMPGQSSLIPRGFLQEPSPRSRSQQAAAPHDLTLI